MKIPRVKFRSDRVKKTMGKQNIIELMHELEPHISRRKLATAYDQVTRALNLILISYGKKLPKDTHLRIVMRDCVTLNLCWLVGSKSFAPYPSLWVSAGRRLRKHLYSQRCEAYKEWKRQGRKQWVGPK